MWPFYYSWDFPRRTYARKKASSTNDAGKKFIPYTTTVKKKFLPQIVRRTHRSLEGEPKISSDVLSHHWTFTDPDDPLGVSGSDDARSESQDETNHEETGDHRCRRWQCVLVCFSSKNGERQLAVAGFKRDKTLPPLRTTCSSDGQKQIHVIGLDWS